MHEEEYREPIGSIREKQPGISSTKSLLSREHGTTMMKKEKEEDGM